MVQVLPVPALASISLLPHSGKLSASSGSLIGQLLSFGGMRADLDAALPDPVKQRAVDALRQGLEAAVGQQRFVVGEAARQAGLLVLAAQHGAALIGVLRLLR